MKFLVDMPLSPKTANFLNSLGHEAVHLLSIGKERATDEEIVQMARSQNQIVISTDFDFGSILAHSLAITPSIILLRIEHATVEKVNIFLTRLLKTLKVEDLQNSIVIVDDIRVRLRKLPLH
ncbi:MAG: DUF5615 family PIN-like protein [Chlamydiae bacterium]|nr:DUF5615 family PIN-like protein [Chlamydiota bacterium]MBI3277632.1 DUF5615 family PIN-like protein [Chlamydiota bacterium]